MALEQLEMETGLNKEDYAIQLLQTWQPKEGYYLGFSGGVDSQIIYDLAKRAKVKFDAHYCVSPIDPPQVQQFIKQYYPDVIWDYHARGFLNLIVKNDLPDRSRRWCCRFIKEAGGWDRICVFGNRADEGNNRKHQCFIDIQDDKPVVKSKRRKSIIRPILKITNYDRWQYILKYKLPHCDIYDMGYERVGCVLCPNSHDKDKQLIDFPKTCNIWRLACDKLVEKHKAKGYLKKNGQPMKYQFKTGEEMFNWWIKRR
jgi:phosphoadenosine phosphosulfate reductase